MNFQICPLTVKINGQINGFGCGVEIIETFGARWKILRHLGAGRN